MIYIKFGNQNNAALKESPNERRGPVALESGCMQRSNAERGSCARAASPKKALSVCNVEEQEWASKSIGNLGA